MNDEEKRKLAARNLTIIRQFEEYIDNAKEPSMSFDLFCLMQGYSNEFYDLMKLDGIQKLMKKLDLKRRVLLKALALQTPQGAAEELAKLETDEANLIEVKIIGLTENGITIRKDVEEMIERKRKAKKMELKENADS